jgi:hypothetical protein
VSGWVTPTAYYTIIGIERDVVTGSVLQRPGLQRTSDANRAGRADILLAHALGITAGSAT